ncbi:MAG TPA: S4 domain-containing protein, partial [Myxococcaceae bacterium]
MSKSLDNYVGVAEPPSEMFGKLMSISDDLMWRYAELLSGRPLEAIRADRERVARGELHPKDVKVAFAREMVARFHGEEAGTRAAEEFERRFSRREIDPDQFPEKEVGTGGVAVPLLRAMVDAQLVASTSEGRRLIAQGAVRVDGERVSDPKAELAPGTHLVQVGKLRAARLTVR